jgi:hypothetical protein
MLKGDEKFCLFGNIMPKDLTYILFIIKSYIFSKYNYINLWLQRQKNIFLLENKA